MRAHEVLQELRDISSMAIEHFDEKIVPEIKKNRPEATQMTFYDMMLTSPRCASIENLHSSFNLSKAQSETSLSASSSTMRKEGKQKSKIRSKVKSILEMCRRQAKIIKFQARQLNKMDTNIKSMKRRLDDSDIKNRELSESIRQLKGVNEQDIESDLSPPAKKMRSATMVIQKHLKKK